MSNLHPVFKGIFDPYLSHPLSPTQERPIEREFGEQTLTNTVISDKEDNDIRVNLRFKWEKTGDGLLVDECECEFLQPYDAEHMDDVWLRDQCIDKLYWSTCEDTRWPDFEKVKRK